MEAKTEGVKAWNGEISHPVMVRWTRSPGLWEQGALLALVAVMIDATASNPTDQ